MTFGPLMTSVSQIPFFLNRPKRNKGQWSGSPFQYHLRKCLLYIITVRQTKIKISITIEINIDYFDIENGLYCFIDRPKAKFSPREINNNIQLFVDGKLWQRKDRAQKDQSVDTIFSQKNAIWHSLSRSRLLDLFCFHINTSILFLLSEKIVFETKKRVEFSFDELIVCAAVTGLDCLIIDWNFSQ